MWQWVPNAITLFRLILCIPLGVLIVRGAYEAALGLMIVATLSDLVDGWLARHLHCESPLGALLDPVADKLLMLVSLLCLGWVGLAPDWFVWLVLLRDLVVVAGALAFRVLVGPFRVAPLRSGKWAMATQMIALVCFVASAIPGVFPGIVWAIWPAAALTLVSGVLYVRIWWSRYRESAL